MDHFSSDQNLPVMIGIFLFNDSGFARFEIISTTLSLMSTNKKPRYWAGFVVINILLPFHLNPSPTPPSVETSSQTPAKRTPQWARNQHPHSGPAGSLLSASGWHLWPDTAIGLTGCKDRGESNSKRPLLLSASVISWRRYWLLYIADSSLNPIVNSSSVTRLFIK